MLTFEWILISLFFRAKNEKHIKSDTDTDTAMESVYCSFMRNVQAYLNLCMYVTSKQMEFVPKISPKKVSNERHELYIVHETKVYIRSGSLLHVVANGVGMT